MQKVRIKKNWGDAGRVGTQLGEPVFVLQWWTPLVWDDEEDPDFHKTAGLEKVDNE